MIIKKSLADNIGLSLLPGRNYNNFDTRSNLEIIEAEPVVKLNDVKTEARNNLAQFARGGEPRNIGGGLEVLDPFSMIFWDAKMHRSLNSVHLILMTKYPQQLHSLNDRRLLLINKLDCRFMVWKTLYKSLTLTLAHFYTSYLHVRGAMNYQVCLQDLVRLYMIFITIVRINEIRNLNILIKNTLTVREG